MWRRVLGWIAAGPRWLLAGLRWVYLDPPKSNTVLKKPAEYDWSDQLIGYGLVAAAVLLGIGVVVAVIYVETSH
jgi:hypothetical protein